MSQQSISMQTINTHTNREKLDTTAKMFPHTTLNFREMDVKRRKNAYFDVTIPTNARVRTSELDVGPFLHTQFNPIHATQSNPYIFAIK